MDFINNLEVPGLAIFLYVCLLFYCPTVTQSAQLIFLLFPARFSPMAFSAITGTGTEITLTPGVFRAEKILGMKILPSNVIF